MAKVISIDRVGGPEVLGLEGINAFERGHGKVRLCHEAVGLNYADTYFSNGSSPIPLAKNGFQPNRKLKAA